MANSNAPKLIDVLAEGIEKLQSEVDDFRKITQLIQGTSETKDPAATLAQFELALSELEASFNELLIQQDTLIEAQTLLASERRRYQEMFEQNPEAQVLTDEFGIVTEANHAAEELFRLSKKYLLCKPLAPLFLFKNRRRFRACLNQLRYGEKVKRWEDSLQFAQGDVLPVEVTVIAVDYSWGRLLHWSIRDMYTAKLAEMVLHNTNEALEQRMQERLQTLNELNLQLSEEILERQRTEQALQQQIERERLTQFIARKIRQTLDLKDVLQTTVQEVQPFLGADRVLVCQFMEDGTCLVIAEAITRGLSKTIDTPMGDPCFQQTVLQKFAEGDIRVINDVEAEITDACLLQLYRGFQVQASVTVPLLQSDNLWGLLIVHHCKSPRRWEQVDLELLENLATHVAIAIQQSQLYEQVQRLAITDALTQVANRYRFESYLEETWQRLLQQTAPLSLVLCDIDYFKRYNDTCGHQAGDCCLRQVAQILIQVAGRPGDLVARYGGEEFAIILPNTDGNGATQMVAAIRSAIATAQIPHIGGLQGYLTLSFGVVTTTSQAAAKISALIHAADEQLYQAKSAGRDQWCAIDLNAGG